MPPKWKWPEISSDARREKVARRGKRGKNKGTNALTGTKWPDERKKRYRETMIRMYASRRIDKTQLIKDVKELREEGGFTQRQTCEILGLDKSWMYRIMKRENIEKW